MFSNHDELFDEDYPEPERVHGQADTADSSCCSAYRPWAAAESICETAEQVDEGAGRMHERIVQNSLEENGYPRRGAEK